MHLNPQGCFILFHVWFQINSIYSLLVIFLHFLSSVLWVAFLQSILNCSLLSLLLVFSPQKVSICWNFMFHIPYDSVCISISFYFTLINHQFNYFIIILHIFLFTPINYDSFHRSFSVVSVSFPGSAILLFLRVLCINEITGFSSVRLIPSVPIMLWRIDLAPSRFA
jgi:hypothetical protein